MFLNISDFEDVTIFKLFLNTKGLTSPKNFKELIPIFVDVLLHSKTKQEFTLCTDNAKLHLKAVL